MTRQGQEGEECPGLQFVVPIVTKADKVSHEDMQAALPRGLQVRSTDQLVAECGSEYVPVDGSKPVDLAVIMYTSGTTGPARRG